MAYLQNGVIDHNNFGGVVIVNYIAFGHNKYRLTIISIFWPITVGVYVSGPVIIRPYVTKTCRSIFVQERHSFYIIQ